MEWRDRASPNSIPWDIGSPGGAVSRRGVNQHACELSSSFIEKIVAHERYRTSPIVP